MLYILSVELILEKENKILLSAETEVHLLSNRREAKRGKIRNSGKISQSTCPVSVRGLEFVAKTE